MGVDDNKGENWGTIDVDKGVCMFNKNILERILKDNGFSFKAVSKKWAELGYIERNSHDRIVHQKKIDGALTSYIRLILPKAETLTKEEYKQIEGIFNSQ